MTHTLSSEDFSFAAPERNGGAAYRKDNFPAPYVAVERPVAGRFMTTVDKGEPVSCHVFMLHGGGYVMEAMDLHTDQVRVLADRGLRVTAFAYPLAPEHTMDEIHAAVDEAYALVRESYPDDRFAVYGDSAGGGLGLNLLMRLRDRGDASRPMKSVWASPALDLSMENPDILRYKDIDKSLDYDGAKALGEILAKNEDVKQAKFSPLYGDLTELGEMLMFYGEGELLRPDCEKFANMALQGTEVTAVMGRGMFHDYLMMVRYGYRQVLNAFDRFVEFLNETA